jgi:hypothetical protein
MFIGNGEVKLTLHMVKLNAHEEQSHISRFFHEVVLCKYHGEMKGCFNITILKP